MSAATLFAGERDAVHVGDCRAVMAALETESVDAIVTDPPYGLAFMGKAWDHGVPGVGFWTQALRVATPGAHLVAFGGRRTYHRLTCAIEDAGWEVRDCLMWLYGNGLVANRKQPRLRPAYEPVVVARAPGIASHSGEIATGWPRAANVVLDDSAARSLGAVAEFFYCPKATSAEREAGCNGMEITTFVQGYSSRPESSPDREGDIGLNRPKRVRNHHPTVKPLDLMRWLCRLVTPAGGLVLDPFCGSGTTGAAAIAEGFAFTGIEIDAGYAAIAAARIRELAAQRTLAL